MRKKSTAPYVVVISEHHGRAGSPVGMLAEAFVVELKGRKDFSVYFLHTNAKYSPGGLKKSRVWNYLKLYVASFFVILFFRVRSLISGRRLILVPTTNPPLLYLCVCFFSKLFCFQVVVWFQDANVDFLYRKFRGSSWFLRGVVEFLFELDNRILAWADGIIVLDDGMSTVLKQRLSERVRSKIHVVPPWVTYVEPARELNVKVWDGFLKEGVKILYAGNYGRSHDLKEMFDLLDRMNVEKKMNLKVLLHFIGISEEAKLTLQAELQNKLFLNLKFFPRRESVQSLLDLFLEYDFGLVSLSNDFLGISCPSKVYTYLSQGLPILYCGPKGTMGEVLANSGWGFTLGDFERFLLGDASVLESVFKHKGQFFENPRTKSLDAMCDVLESLNIF